MPWCTTHDRMVAKKLAGFDDLYRQRVGDWRISYALEEDQLIILIVEIASRGGAYRNIRK